MKPSFIALLFSFLLLVMATIWILSRTTNPTDTSLPTVGATTTPIADITSHIAGGILNVERILPPGVSPHTFEPSPSDMKRLEDAHVIYVNGLELDTWALVIAESLAIETVDLSAPISPIEDLHEGTFDPHYWLTPQNAALMAQTIAQDLSTRFPEHTQTFQTNLKTYLTELSATDGQIREILAGLDSRTLVTFHNSFAYFAKEYDLEVIGTFEPTAGREPTSQELVQLTQAIEQYGVTTVYSEPQLSDAPLAAFLNDNHLHVAVLDPIGGFEGRTTLIDLLLYNANVISQNQ